MEVRRTDLALESAERLAVPEGVPGLRRQETVEDGIPLTVVEVTHRDAARRLGKPLGRYVTLDLRPLRRREKEAFARSANLLAREIAKLLPPGEGPALVVSLGNRQVTPDAIGPLVHEGLLVTRHLIHREPERFGAFRSVAALAPGVLGSTGVESGDLAAAVTRAIRPHCVVAVDALAAGSVDRLCATVQLSDSGVSPGSGVGNHRQALTRETLGVPVVAIGVPTVVDGVTLALDLLAEADMAPPDPRRLSPQEGRLYVTPRDIDVQVRESAKLIAAGLNLALQPGLTLADLEALTD